jgi:protocatechuate 3,4-dioxygenase beta subunit
LVVVYLEYQINLEANKMKNDDRQVGRILSRREFLSLLGATGAALLAGCVAGQLDAGQPASTATQAASTQSTQATSDVTSGAVPACVVRPEETEGPYFVDEKINRSDIRSDPADGSVKDGLPLELAFLVSQVSDGACTPLEGATVDVWHCDAQGVYSDVSDPGFNTKGKKFLRGYQTTDANGMAKFTTIYPGWYQGRTVHIHFKIRSASGSGSTYEFTSQLFFDDAITDQVHAQEPYASKGQRTLRNDGDGIYQNGGSQLLLQLTQTDQGYKTTFPIGLQI